MSSESEVPYSRGVLPELPGFGVVDTPFYEGSRLTVLAVGNPIMGDDGIGLQIFARLRELAAQRPSWESAVNAGELTFVEGATGGMELVPVVQESERLLILDSIASGQTRVPGQALHFSGDYVPRLLSMKISPHQVSLLDILSSSRLTGREPQVIEVVGVVAEDVDLRLGLSEAAQSGIAEAVRLSVEVIDGWL